MVWGFRAAKKEFSTAAYWKRKLSTANYSVLMPTVHSFSFDIPSLLSCPGFIVHRHLGIVSH
jgi:hypothetical protein